MKKAIFIFGLAIVFTCGSQSLFAQNYKIKQATSMSGRSFSSTVYVKGARKRSESSGTTDIEQCDLKRTIKINDSKKLYFIEPFQTDLGSSASSSAATAPTGKATKGGTITMATSITDTGERKQLFGLTARRVKTLMTMKSSPDACDDNDVQIETDGWYVDLPQFSCPVTVPANPFAQMNEPKRGCTDRMIVKNTGTGKLGFALSLTQKFKMGGEDDEDMPSITQTLETLEFSTATLNDLLFDIPVGYKAANSAAEINK